MKKIIIAAMCAFFLIGCAGMQVTGTPAKSLEYTLAYDVGVVAAIKEPGFAKAAVTYGQGLLVFAKDGTITTEQISQAQGLLAAKLGMQPEYQAAMAIFMNQIGGGFQIQTGKVDPKIVDAIQGFIDGMKAITGSVSQIEQQDRATKLEMVAIVKELEMMVKY
jgi:hypothetical protein